MCEFAYLKTTCSFGFSDILHQYTPKLPYRDLLECAIQLDAFFYHQHLAMILTNNRNRKIRLIVTFCLVGFFSGDDVCGFEVEPCFCI